MSELGTDPEVLAGYLDEASDCLTVLDEKLLAVEESGADPETVQEMFRAAHSIKGMAGMLNLADICGLTHSMETVLSKVRDGKLEFTAQVIDALFLGLDVLGTLHRDLRRGELNAVEIDGPIAKLEAVVADIQEEATAPEDELGPVPEFLKGRLSLDDVLEAYVEKNGGRRIYALSIPLQKVFGRMDPAGLYRELESVLSIQTAFSTLNAPDSPFAPLEDFGFDAHLLCFCDTDIREALARISVPACQAWELCTGDILPPPAAIKETYNVKLDAQPLPLAVLPDMRKHIDTWASETREELEALDNLIVAYEETPGNRGHLNGVMQVFHRMKASSACVGLDQMAGLIHRCESVLAPFRDGERAPDARVFQALYTAKDLLFDCLRRVEAGQEDGPDVAPLEEVLAGLLLEEVASTRGRSMLDAWEPGLEELTQLEAAAARGFDVWQIAVAIAPRTPMADLRARMVLQTLGRSGEVLGSIPHLDELEDGLESLELLYVLYATRESEERIRTALQLDLITHTELRLAAAGERAQEDAAVPEETTTVAGTAAPAESPRAQAGAPQGAGPVSDTMRVDVGRLDQLLNITGELVITKARVTQLVESLIEPLRGADLYLLESLVAGARAQEGEGNGVARMQFGEARLAKAEEWLRQFKGVLEQAAVLREATLTLHRHTSMMQNSAMQMRMVPIGPLFQRFHRVVRDVCKARGRNAQLVTVGESTELDKKLIDALADPLTHLVRNAVDHGLESPEERLSAGKPEQGRVRLEAFHEGGQICVRVSDDGKGLDVERIRTKIVEKGLLTEGQSRELSDKDVMQYIFHPGFSTAAQVTNVSGRGVGMDIVKSTVSELKGTVDLESEPGTGTSFVIRLPLTLAMIKALLVEIGGGAYALPLESVREIVDLQPEDINSIEGKGKAIFLREEGIALVPLDRVMGLHAARNGRDVVRAVVARAGDRTLAIPVDRVIGDDEIVVKALTEEFEHVRGVSGATILGNGSIALILDAASILEQSAMRGDGEEWPQGTAETYAGAGATGSQEEASCWM